MYDIIILGGGIAGLNCAYQILKKSSVAPTILILEKEHVLGGRVDTYNDRYMSVEAGGSRFHTGQHHIMKLISELGLSSKLVPIHTNMNYADSDSGKIIDSTNMYSVLINKLIRASTKVSPELLIDKSFLDFAETVLDKADVQFLQNSFGYYSELVIMNARDAMHLITQHLLSKHQFYVLSGGVSQIIENLTDRILAHSSSQILKNRNVCDILRIDTGFEISCTGIQKKYYGKKVICALPKQVIEEITLFRPIKPMLRHIVCAPLCRIYSKFSLVNGEPWFKNISKLTTNNNLRMIIPVDSEKGIIMVSYSDNKYARFWKRIYDKGGEDSINKEIARLTKKSTGIDIPEPVKTNIFFWGCGVGYWGIGADSAALSRDLVQPFKDMNLFICGEHFSEKNQQWMEGALDTGEIVINKIM